MMHQLEALLDQLRGLWRFRWLGMAAAWGVFLLGLLVILLLRDRYAASSTVFVDTQTALGAATRDMTVDSSVDAQIQRVREALLGGPQLAKIADETGLTARAITPQERQEVIERLRRQISISGRIAHESSGAGIYVVSYTHEDRDTSLKVVDRLVNTFVEDALGGKREGSEQAQKFLIDQITQTEKELREAEDKLAEFKKSNVGMMPGAQGDYFTRLQADTEALNSSQAALSVAIGRRDKLQRQLRGEQPLVPNAASGQADGSSGVPPMGGETAARLRESQQRLDELRLRFTDRYPDVVALRETVKELEARQAAEIEAARSGDAGAAARSGLSASPVYQSLQLQFNQAEVEIAALQADIADRQKRIASLRGLMNTAPEVEAQFSRLNRDYGVKKAQYEAFVQRLSAAKLGEEAAQTGVIRFEIIDPPRASFDPVFPNRPLYAVAALIGALGGGVGLAFLLNLLRPVFSGTRQLGELTGLPVLGAVSMTWIERHNARVRRSVLHLAIATFAMVALCALFILVQQPLVSSIRAWMA